jgi:peptide/nickel transport system permease protein
VIALWFFLASGPSRAVVVAALLALVVALTVPFGAVGPVSGRHLLASAVLVVAGIYARRLRPPQPPRVHGRARAALAILAVVVDACCAAGVWAWFSGASSLTVALDDRFLPPGWPHVLGTDALGRDVLVRLLEGGQIALFVGAGAALSSVAFGGAIGLFAGVRGGALDAVIVRVIDLLLALPTLPLLLLLASVDVGVTGPFASVVRVVAITVALGWMPVARVARASARDVMGKDFVVGARALGASVSRIVVVHVLPHALPAVLVTATAEVASFLLAEASLSFLGLGIAPPLTSWGAQLEPALVDLHTRPLLAILPGVMILVTVGCFHFLGDGMRDALDPHKGRSSR